MRYRIIWILLLVSTFSFGQKLDTKCKLDSILLEADLLYNYEKAVWNSTDILMKNIKLKENYGGYITYKSEDSIFVSYIAKSQKKRIAKYSYLRGKIQIPVIKDESINKLSIREQKYLDVKRKISSQLSNAKYNIRIPQGYNPNLVLASDDDINFRLYILMGTTKSGIIPFGNDFIFYSDNVGNISDWKKFHSVLIPTPNKTPEGEKIVKGFHSHLKSTPYITATDICTFRLYANYCNMTEFSVLCTATDMLYTYNIETNKITVEKR